MNKQKIFNTVAKHLLTQGCQAIDPTINICQYKDHLGNKCAIGCLISPEIYSPDLEGAAVDNYKVVAALNASGIAYINSSDIELLQALQTIHDGVMTHLWKERLQLLATDFGLEFQID